MPPSMQCTTYQLSFLAWHFLAERQYAFGVLLWLALQLIIQSLVATDPQSLRQEVDAEGYTVCHTAFLSLALVRSFSTQLHWQ